MHRRVDDPQVTRAVRRHDGGRGVEVRVERLVTDRCDPRRSPASYGIAAAGPAVGDRGRDLGVDRRDDLRTGAVVDLVAVVGGRVVARGHHHAGGGAEVAHRVRGHRCRPRRDREPHRDARGGEHARRVAREHVGEMAVVEADHHAALGPVRGDEDSARAPPRGPHDREVHAVRARRRARRAAPRSRTAASRRSARRARRCRPRRATPRARPACRVGIAAIHARTRSAEFGRRRSPRHQERGQFREVVSGRAPRWEITSAAASDPSRAHVSRSASRV